MTNGRGGAKVCVGMTALPPTNVGVVSAHHFHLALRRVEVGEDAFTVALDATTSAVGCRVIAFAHQTTTPQKPEQDAG